MASKSSGSGGVVAFAIDPAGDGRQGYELLPDAATLVGEELARPSGRKHRARRSSSTRAASRSPSRPTRSGSPTCSPGPARASPRSLRWNYDFTDPANNTDYKSLIDALHARGILAYAWLEPPYVTLRMWQDHPECREKTKTGREAIVDWRSLIALEDPACFTLATQSWTHVLTRVRVGRRERRRALLRARHRRPQLHAVQRVRARAVRPRPGHRSRGLHAVPHEPRHEAQRGCPPLRQHAAERVAPRPRADRDRRHARSRRSAAASAATSPRSRASRGTRARRSSSRTRTPPGRTARFATTSSARTSSR